MNEWIVKEDGAFRAWVRAVDAERRVLGIAEKPPDLKAAIERWRARKSLVSQPQTCFFLVMVERVNGYYRARSLEIDGCSAEGDSPVAAKAALAKVLQARLVALANQRESVTTRVMLDVVKVHMPIVEVSG